MAFRVCDAWQAECRSSVGEEGKVAGRNAAPDMAAHSRRNEAIAPCLCAISPCERSLMPRVFEEGKGLVKEAKPEEEAGAK